MLPRNHNFFHSSNQHFRITNPRLCVRGDQPSIESITIMHTELHQTTGLDRKQKERCKSRYGPWNYNVRSESPCSKL